MVDFQKKRCWFADLKSGLRWSKQGEGVRGVGWIGSEPAAGSEVEGCEVGWLRSELAAETDDARMLATALEGKEVALSSDVSVAVGVEVGDSVSDFVVVLVVASRVVEGAAVGRTRLAG